MSAPEQTATESRSSVKLSLNAKGEVQIEVKSYVGDSEAAMMDARDRAIHTLEQTITHFATSGVKIAGRAPDRVPA